MAAVLDPVDGTVERLVSWPELPAPDTDASWTYFPQAPASTEQVWAQPGSGGPVALLGTDGLVHASYVVGNRLCAVTEAGAWCAPQLRRQDLADTADTPPRVPLLPERLLLVRPDGTTRAVTVDHPVREVWSSKGGVHVRVDVEPWTRRHLGGRTWELNYEQSWLHLPPEVSIPDALTVSEHGGAAPSVPPLCSDGRRWGSPWHDRAEEGSEGPVAGGMCWRAGWDPDVGEQRHVVATGHDRIDGSRRCGVELGAGTVVALAGSPRWLWVALLRGGRVAPAVGGTVELVRVDTVGDSTHR